MTKYKLKDMKKLDYNENVDYEYNIKYSSLINKKIKEIISKDEKSLPVFKDFIDKIPNDKENIIQYWNSLVRFKVCAKCNKKFEYATEEKFCPRCHGKITPFFPNIDDDLSNDIFTLFWEFHRHPVEIIQEIESQKIKLEEEKAELNEKRTKLDLDLNQSSNPFLNQNNKDESQEELRNELSSIIGQIKSYEKNIQNLNKVLDEILNSTFMEIIQKGKYANLAFNIRMIEKQVDILKANITKTEEGSILFYNLMNSEPISRVISNYYPFSIQKKRMKTYIVTKIEEDLFKSKEITQRLENSEISSKYYCPNCMDFFNKEKDSNFCPICEKKLEKLRFFYPKKVYLQNTKIKIKEEIHENPNYINLYKLYPLTNSKRNPKKTYAEISYYLEDTDFIKERSVLVKNEDGEKLFELVYGSLTLYIYSDNFKTYYEDGTYDHTSRGFKVCKTCNHIWNQGKDEDNKLMNYCPINIEEHQKFQFIRLITDLPSQGINIKFYNFNIEQENVLGHTLAHVLRTALQKIAGVDLRDIGEVEDNNGQIYIYDSISGGNSICASLFSKECLKEAFNTIRYVLDDDCENGCPSCLYQFNCIKRNNPNNFNKIKLKKIINCIDEKTLEIEDFDEDD